MPSETKTRENDLYIKELPSLSPWETLNAELPQVASADELQAERLASAYTRTCSVLPNDPSVHKQVAKTVSAALTMLEDPEFVFDNLNRSLDAMRAMGIDEPRNCSPGAEVLVEAVQRRARLPEARNDMLFLCIFGNSIDAPGFLARIYIRHAVYMRTILWARGEEPLES